MLAETCAQYLVLDDSAFEGPDGHLFACCPQVKTPKDQDRLWQGLRDGEVRVVSTDTCTFTREQKARWEGDRTKIPMCMGLFGLETPILIVHTHGVQQGRLTLEQMVEKCSTNPAKVMGLYPRKGVIAPGSDADLALIDPDKTIEVDHATMETNADWSLYTGMETAALRRVDLQPGASNCRRLPDLLANESRGRLARRSLAGSQGHAESQRPIAEP